MKYRDASNREVTQLAVVGNNNVHLIDARLLGMGRESTPQGVASNWLRDLILKAMGKKE